MVSVASLLPLLALLGSAAENDFDQRYPACFLDRLEHCKDAFGLAATLQCLDRNQDGLMPSCKASLEKSPVFQCSSEALLLCPLANDHYDLMACLWTQRPGRISARCAGSGLGGGEFHECKQDKKKFCKGMSGFPRVMACLADHDAELSSECRAAMEACPAFKCAHDAERFCPNADSHHDFAKCIWHHRDEVSQECKDVISSPPLSLFSRHHGHHKKHHDHRHKHHGGHHERHHGGRHGHRGYHGGYHYQKQVEHHEGDLERRHKGHHHHHHRHHHHHDDHEHGRYFRACKFDIRRFCYDVDGFVDKMACLASHQDELSDSCHMVLKRCPAFHCAHDVQKFCPGVKNKHEFIGCLWEHRHELSDECMNQDSHDDGQGHHEHSDDKCRHERERLCPEDQKESPKHDVECLGNQNQDEFSHECRKSLHIRGACKDEVEKFCSSDSSYPLRCLKQHEQDLGEECKAALVEGGPEKSLSMGSSSIMSKPLIINYRNVAALGAILATVLITTSLVVLTCRKRKAAQHHAENQYQRI